MKQTQTTLNQRVQNRNANGTIARKHEFEESDSRCLVCA